MITPDPFTSAVDAADEAGIDESSAAGSDAVAADSPLARLRRAYAARRREAELFLTLPGWGDALVARVTVPDHDFAREIQGAPGTIDWMGDFIATTVAGLYQTDGVDEHGRPRLVALESDFGPVRFDPQFGAAVGLPEVRSARAAVHSVFTVGGEDSVSVVNIVALADFANKIEHWLADTSRDIAEAIVPGR